MSYRSRVDGRAARGSAQVRLPGRPLPVPAVGRAQRPARAAPLPGGRRRPRGGGRAQAKKRRRGRDKGADLRDAVEPRLEVVAAMGHDPGASWAVGDGATMGRSDNADIRVDDPFASSAHARIFSRGDFMWIEDMGSTNGTYLNGRTLRVRRAAQDGRRRAHRRQRVPLPGVAVALTITEQAALSDVGRPALGQRGLLRGGAALLRRRRRHGRSQGGRGRLADRRRGLRRRRRAPRTAPEARAARHRAVGQPAHLRPRPGRGVPPRHGHHADRRIGGGRRGQPRPRRRQPLLPDARRRAGAADPRPLAGGRARAHGPDRAGRGGAPPPALDHHPGARPRARRRRGHLHDPRPARTTCSCSARTG